MVIELQYSLFAFVEPINLTSGKIWKSYLIQFPLLGDSCIFSKFSWIFRKFLRWDFYCWQNQALFLLIGLPYSFFLADLGLRHASPDGFDWHYKEFTRRRTVPFATTFGAMIIWNPVRLLWFLGVHLIYWPLFNHSFILKWINE